MSKKLLMLMLLTALLSNSSGTNVVPSLKFVFMMLVTQLKESHDKPQSALFLLVNVIVIAIWLRSSSVVEHGNKYDELVMNNFSPAYKHEKQQIKSKLLSPCTVESPVHDQHKRASDILDVRKNEMKKYFHKDAQDAVAPTSIGKRRVSYPLICSDIILQEAPVNGTESPSSKHAKRHEKLLIYKDDLLERSESFIAKHRDVWRQENRIDSFRRGLTDE
ncbi:hypothetical protein O6H91_04G056900 [Diphasiastrum complanatum]|uniref:Uncharacterized protein n=1 Tax=Diphasiastrum complanatum TaxID=34168 RepID=A0ACC2DX11_DIPCM|nr:hypothetical protein O6H91_04G056900 [Diphasiastrum complanatum]